MKDLKRLKNLIRRILKENEELSVPTNDEVGFLPLENGEDSENNNQESLAPEEVISKIKDLIVQFESNNIGGQQNDVSPII